MFILIIKIFTEKKCLFFGMSKFFLYLLIKTFQRIMMKDMDNMCGIIAVVLLVLVFMNFQRDYRIVHKRAGSACSMASSQDNVSGKASLSIEPEATESDETSPLEIGVLNKDVAPGIDEPSALSHIA